MKKSLLFFIESLSGGGAETVLVTLLSHLDYRKYNVKLLTLVDNGELRNDIDRGKVSYSAIIYPSTHLLPRTWNKVKYKLIYHYLPIKRVNRWIIPQKGIDLYVAFTEGFSTKLLAYSPGKKIAWVHTDLKQNPWPLKLAIFKEHNEEKDVYARYDTIVSVSHAVENIMKGYYGLHQTQTIYNPVDGIKILEQSRLDCNVKVSGDFNIVTSGRLVYQKGFDLLIPIMGKLMKEGLDIHLYIFGNGPERNKLETIAALNGVADNVHFVGFMKNPFPLMRQADLFVCSSRAEGFSLVIAEAIILGLPVISMSCSGPDELLKGGKYGVLCNSYEELAHAIKKAVTEKGYLQELSKKAISRKPFFDIQKTMSQVETLFDQT